jgi:16S rRNA (guanine527-N7)-methyltransferase
MRLDSLIKIVRKNISPEQHNALPNGVICLKGGDLEEEIKSFSNLTTVYDLSDIFEEQFFETKKVIHVVINNGKK